MLLILTSFFLVNYYQLGLCGKASLSPSSSSCLCIDGCTYTSEARENAFCETKINSTQLSCRIKKPSFKFNYRQMPLNSSSSSSSSSCSCDLLSKPDFKLTIDGVGLFDSSSSVADILKILQLLDRNVSYVEINLSGIRGINVESPLKLNSSSHQFIWLNLYDSHLKFFNTRGRSIRTCAEFETTLLEKNSSSSFNVGNNNNDVYVSINSTRLGEPVCELLFRNVRLERLEIKDTYETYFKTNLLRFLQQQQLQQSKETSLNCSVKQFELVGENIFLDSRILNARIFTHLEKIEFSRAVFNSLHNDAFLGFKHLTSIQIDYMGLMSLTRQQGVTWTRSINSDLSVDLYAANEIAQNINRLVQITLVPYQRIKPLGSTDVILYSDTDFCAYLDWPFRQLVFVRFASTILFSQNLSCLAYSLLQHHSRVNDVWGGFYFLDFINLNHSSEACNFTRMTSRCDKRNYETISNKNIIKNNRYQFNSFDFLHVSEYLVLVATPVASLFGFVLNLLVIGVLVNKSFVKEFKEKQYTFMVAVSAFNALVCFFQALSIINECQRPAQLFCSTIRKSHVTQYYKIVFLEFFQHFFISLSNCSYLAFGLCRISLVGIKHSRFIRFVSETGVKKLLASFVVYSCLISLVKPFRHKLNDSLYGGGNTATTFPEPSFLGSSVFHTNRHVFKLVFFANIVYDFVNYCCYVLLIIVVDVVMLVKVRQVLRDKEKKACDQSEEKRSKMKKENRESFKMLVKFVVFNSASNMCLKLPSCFTSLNDIRIFFSNLYYFVVASTYVYDAYVFPYPLGYLCVVTKVCQVFQLLGRFLLVVSLSSNFFFLKKFDRNFQQALEAISISKKTIK